MGNTPKPQSGLDALPVYVPGLPIEEVQRQYGVKDVIKLASNENPFGSSPKALQALADGVNRIHYYPDGHSHDLREALSRHLAIPATHLAIGNGADGLIMQLCLAYLDEGSQVVTSQSSFPIYDIYTQVMRATLVKTPLKDFGFDLEAILKEMNNQTRLVFICNPNNPTGTALNASEFFQFLNAVPEHVLVVSDEAYYEFVDMPDFPDTVTAIKAGQPNLITLRTFSKSYGLAGIRLGYAIGNPQILEPLFRVKEPFSVNLLAQVAGVAALQDDEFLRYTMQATRAGREQLYAVLDRLDLRYVPSHTNFVLVELGVHAAQIIQRLLERGVIIRPGKGYDLPEWARITIGNPVQIRRLGETLSEVLNSIRVTG